MDFPDEIQTDTLDYIKTRDSVPNTVYISTSPVLQQQQQHRSISQHINLYPVIYLLKIIFIIVILKKIIRY